MWVAAGSNPVYVMKATVITWLLLNVYKTGARLFKMRKVKSPECVLCHSPLEDQLHFALACSALFNIRSAYINKFIELCPILTNFLSDEKTLLLSLLDPYSPLLPAEIREGWTDQDLVYKTSRNYFYDLHKKREKIIGSEKQESDNSKIMVALYKND